MPCCFGALLGLTIEAGLVTKLLLCGAVAAVMRELVLQAPFLCLLALTGLFRLQLRLLDSGYHLMPAHNDTLYILVQNAKCVPAQDLFWACSWLYVCIDGPGSNMH